MTLRDLTYIGGLRSDNSTALGSINGSSRIKIDTAAYKFKGVGKQAYVYGGHNDNNDIVIVNSNINVDLVSDSGKIVYGSEDSVKEEFVLKDIRINGRIAE